MSSPRFATSWGDEAANHESPVAIGEVLAGRYRIDRLIDRGGFGAVYSAYHLVLNGPVAIKILRPDRLTRNDRASSVAAFLEEARTLAKLRHPNIVSVLDAGVLTRQPLPWMALEWCDGVTLAKALRDGQLDVALKPRATWELLRPVVVAMAYAHGQHIAHRDLKPSNIMLVGPEDRRVARVLDFGMAKKVDPADSTAPATETQTREPGSFTPSYAAPEQITWSRTGPWTDVHALALMFVEILTGRAPYPDENPLEACVAAERPTPKALGVDVEPALEEVLARALSLKGQQRQPTAAEFLAELDRVFDGGAAVRASASTTPTIRALPADPSADVGSDDLSASHAAPEADRSPRSSRTAWAAIAAACVFTAGIGSAVTYAALQSRMGWVGEGAELTAAGERWRVQWGGWHVEGDALVGNGGEIMSRTDLADGTFEADYEPLGNATHAIGISVRVEPGRANHHGNGYGINFRLNGNTWNVYKGVEGTWTPVDGGPVDYRPSPIIRPGRNHVVVRMKGPHVDVFLNGEHLASWDDDAYATGRITLWVQSSQERARFFNLRFNPDER